MIWYFQNQWPAVFRPSEYNWVDFTFLEFNIVWEKIYCKIELDAALFGIKFHAEYKYKEESDHPLWLEIAERRDELLRRISEEPQEERLERLLAEAQALCLEHCPEEMSEELKQDWAKHQQPVKG